MWSCFSYLGGGKKSLFGSGNETQPFVQEILNLYTSAVAHPHTHHPTLGNALTFCLPTKQKKMCRHLTPCLSLTPPFLVSCDLLETHETQFGS